MKHTKWKSERQTYRCEKVEFSVTFHLATSYSNMFLFEASCQRSCDIPILTTSSNSQDATTTIYVAQKSLRSRRGNLRGWIRGVAPSGNQSRA